MLHGNMDQRILFFCDRMALHRYLNVERWLRTLLDDGVDRIRHIWLKRCGPGRDAGQTSCARPHNSRTAGIRLHGSQGQFRAFATNPWLSRLVMSSHPFTSKSKVSRGARSQSSNRALMSRFNITNLWSSKPSACGCPEIGPHAYRPRREARSAPSQRPAWRLPFGSKALRQKSKRPGFRPAFLFFWSQASA